MYISSTIYSIISVYFDKEKGLVKSIQKYGFIVIFSIALVFYFEVVALFKCCSGVFLYSGHCLYDPVLFKRGGDAVTVVVEGHFIGHCFDFF